MDGVLLLGSMRTQWNALLSEKDLLVRDKVNEASKRASETREQTLYMLARTESNTYDKRKLCWGLCTLLLFISLFPSLMLNSLIVHRLLDFKCFSEQRGLRILDCCCFTRSGSLLFKFYIFNFACSKSKLAKLCTMRTILRYGIFCSVKARLSLTLRCPKRLCQYEAKIELTL